MLKNVLKIKSSLYYFSNIFECYQMLANFSSRSAHGGNFVDGAHGRPSALPRAGTLGGEDVVVCVCPQDPSRPWDKGPCCYQWDGA